MERSPSSTSGCICVELKATFRLPMEMGWKRQTSQASSHFLLPHSYFLGHWCVIVFVRFQPKQNPARPLILVTQSFQSTTSTIVRVFFHPFVSPASICPCSLILIKSLTGDLIDVLRLGALREQLRRYLLLGTWCLVFSVDERANCPAQYYLELHKQWRDETQWSPGWSHDHVLVVQLLCLFWWGSYLRLSIIPLCIYSFIYR